MLENPRWERFCQLYAVDGNASAAYRNAGYHPKTDSACWSCATKLLRVAQVQARIEELTREAREQAERNSIADIREIRQRITEVLRGQSKFETKSADIIKAGDFLARVGGQIEPPPIKVELSLSDKKARLRELLYDDDCGDD